ncbi:mitotic-spindle organizing protein associated with a ring of gamma-tubulin 1 [Sporothrix brasiliensis 5110]|uniref:Mitotic-spindle organizing protein 1 n=1 Tax=Sporothrix brasiliensis 5110 TaxID=1398154 RepID=A0A0C2FKE3_9PEZI|nr:mitotic-spindle organizing protein associated with a ring of gamma-tubulin 1 [Sporothrix brasiliensis 5110]KIH91538.1 mitotic-spindle organizing protein associated with a ring of gamma-tubulin 1 [Sporothrix brasiliensis 5110]
MPADHTEKQAAAQAAVDILHEMSTILNCQLDRRTLSICISMIENGVSPVALARAVMKLRETGQQVEQYMATQQNR